MVIKKEIEIVHDVDFDLILHIIVGENKRAMHTTIRGGKYIISIDKDESIIRLFSRNLWDTKNIFYIFFIAIMSFIYITFGGNMDKSFAPFGCDYKIELCKKSPENIIVYVSEIINSNLKYLKNWYIVTIMQIAFIAILISLVIFVISMIFNPLLSWVIRGLGLSLVVWVVFLLSRKSRILYKKYRDTFFTLKN